MLEYKERKLKWINTIVIYKPNYKEISKINPSFKKKDDIFKENECYLCLGEIRNMPNHFIYVDKNGKIYWGYHDDYFIRDDNEV